MTRTHYIQPNSNNGNPPASRTVVCSTVRKIEWCKAFAIRNNMYYSALKALPSQGRAKPLPQAEVGRGIFGARYYDANISVWLSVDPMADKYPSFSPNIYCSNNPIKFIDLTGLSFSDFDEDGNYLRTVKNNWWHNLVFGQTGRILDADGNVTQTFKFADPKNDVKSLENGEINRIHFVKEREVVLMLSKAGAFDKENKTYNNPIWNRYDYILKESPAGGRLDFSITQIPLQYSSFNINQTLFLIDGMAHNRFNFGNFLWGAAGKAIGLTLLELKCGAHYRALTQNGEDGYPNQFDSLDDQRSIKQGVRHANSHGYKELSYKVKKP